MRAVRAFLRGSGFYLCALLAMIAVSAVIYLRGAADEASAGAFAPAGGGAACLPVVVYGGISDDGRLWGAACISPGEFESDMEYLRASGYAAVGLQELVDFALNGGPLPEKPVVIAFGEGCLGGYFEALPILRKYGVNAVCARSDIDALLPGKRRMPPVKWVARPHGKPLEAVLVECAAQ